MARCTRLAVLSRILLCEIEKRPTSLRGAAPLDCMARAPVAMTYLGYAHTCLGYRCAQPSLKMRMGSEFTNVLG